MYTQICICVCIRMYIGLPQWLCGEESACNAGETGDAGSVPGSGRSPGGDLMPWRRAWQHTPVFLPWEFQGQRSLVGYSPWGRKGSDITEATEHTCMHVHTHTHTHMHKC